MASHIERRKFLATLSGVAGWPLVARGQQPAMPVVGLLSSAGPDTYAHYIAAFREGLSKFGYIEGQNVRGGITTTAKQASNATVASMLPGLK